jgi:hypothetical protein
MPGDQIPHSVLPLAEMGTAQQEIPVATVNTVHTLQLTTEELRMLARAMSAFNDRDPYVLTRDIFDSTCPTSINFNLNQCKSINLTLIQATELFGMVVSLLNSITNLNFKTMLVTTLAMKAPMAAIGLIYTHALLESYLAA